MNLRKCTVKISTPGITTEPILVSINKYSTNSIATVDIQKNYNGDVLWRIYNVDT